MSSSCRQAWSRRWYGSQYRTSSPRGRPGLAITGRRRKNVPSPRPRVATWRGRLSPRRPGAICSRTNGVPRPYLQRSISMCYRRFEQFQLTVFPWSRERCLGSHNPLVAGSGPARPTLSGRCALGEGSFHQYGFLITARSGRSRQRNSCKTNVLCPNHLETYMKTRSHYVQGEQDHRDHRDDHQQRRKDHDNDFQISLRRLVECSLLLCSMPRS
jgi:hypothetical protein